MPAYMFVTMFYTCLYEYFTSGPMVPPFITDAENCRNNWWINLLMLNNLVDTDNAVILDRNYMHKYHMIRLPE